MKKEVDEEFKGIKDTYFLRCICTELKQENEELKQENEKLKIKNEMFELITFRLLGKVIFDEKS